MKHDSFHACGAPSWPALWFLLLANLLASAGMPMPAWAADVPVPRQTMRVKRVVESAAQVRFFGFEQERSPDLAPLNQQYYGPLRQELIDSNLGSILGVFTPGYDGEPALVTYRVYAQSGGAERGFQEPDFGLGPGTRDILNSVRDVYNRKEVLGPAADQKLILRTLREPDLRQISGEKAYVFTKVEGIFRWNSVTLSLYAVRGSAVPRDPKTLDEPEVQAGIAQEFGEFNRQLEQSVVGLSQKLYATLDRIQSALDLFPALGGTGDNLETGSGNLVTGSGTVNQILWQVREEQVRVSLDLIFDLLIAPATIPDLPHVFGPGPDGAGGGSFQASWSFTLEGGLELRDVQLIQNLFYPDEEPTKPLKPHRLAELLQWRNYSLILEREPSNGPPEVVEKIPVALFGDDPVLYTDILKIADPLNPLLGKRWDHKPFAWGVATLSYPPLIEAPSGSGNKYLLEVCQIFLVSNPLADQEPSHHAVVVKVFPLLTVKIIPIAGKTTAPPSFAADLKMVFAPRLTRRDQHRPTTPVNFYLPASRHDDNIVGVYTDTNDAERPTPSPPHRPNWDIMFDYVQPEMTHEMAFDAVTYPRDLTNTAPFFIHWEGADPTLISGRSGVLRVIRARGQGEFDNVHIHPYVGFDDPAAGSATGDQSRALVEAPLACDEVIHMHWRWGTAPRDSEHVEEFRGYSDSGQPRATLTAPMIPPNQSLRIKIGLNDDNPEPSAQPQPLNPRETAVWYRAMAHRSRVEPFVAHLPFQFGENGYGLAYHLDTLTGIVDITNRNLLMGSEGALGITYHGFRWTRLGTPRQRVPTASDVPGLPKNRLGIKDDPNVGQFNP